MAAAAVLAREAKQQEALELVAKANSRNGTLMRAQLALDAGDAGQVSAVFPHAPLMLPLHLALVPTVSSVSPLIQD